LDDTNARVPATVDTPCVSFGQAEPAFQIEIVLGEIGCITTDEKTRFETGHHFSQMLLVLVGRIACKLFVQACKRSLTLLRVSGRSIQRLGHALDVLDLVTDFFLSLSHTA
jgi:hypothetical protein